MINLISLIGIGLFIVFFLVSLLISCGFEEICYFHPIFGIELFLIYLISPLTSVRTALFIPDIGNLFSLFFSSLL